MSERIHIALTFDDKYWAPAYATMRSVCLFTKKRSSLVFHLLHTGLSEEHRLYLERIGEEFGSSLNYYELGSEAAIMGRIGDLRRPRVRLNPIVYARLLLADILPASVQRVVYLDCDLFVRAPIERLYDLELGKNAIAAAIDPYRTGFQTRRDAKVVRYFDTADPYFNAGILVIDLPKFKEADPISHIAAHLSSEERWDIYFDQDVLNIAFRERCLILEPRWNVQNPLPAHEPFDPLIVHYTGSNKPWRLFGHGCFKRMYRHVMTNEIFYRYWRERVKGRIRRTLKMA